MTTSIFSNQQFLDWLQDEFDQYVNAAYENMKESEKKYDFEEFTETLEWSAIQKMTAQANVELAHHNQKLKKFCGFGNCKYLPSCLRGLE